VLVRARDVERTVGTKFMLTRSAEAFARMCPTLLFFDCWWALFGNRAAENNNEGHSVY
jgi:hypothetical protein